jgi:hypothetical protein
MASQTQCRTCLDHSLLIAAIRITRVATLLFMFCYSASALAGDGTGRRPASPACQFSDQQFDPATDVHALDEYREAIGQLLKQEKFDVLDCLADNARNGKTRFSGGGWKLRNIYIGLEEPQPGHPTQIDWRQHFELIERWKHKNESSMTAKIALAESYISYGWDARGDGYSGDVSNSGWKLFNDRVARAKAVLDGYSSFANKCPDWYLAMLLVAQGQGWDVARLHSLLQKAVAFEPDYQYYYRTYATLVQAKWFGKEGDAAQFAEDSANNTGGKAGDLLYFEIADGILCGCRDPEFPHFSWPPLQKGFAAIEKQYGPSLRNLNAFALMASKANDWVAADPAFKRIADGWDKEVWLTEDWFKQNRDTAAKAAPIQAQARDTRKAAETNLQTPDGPAYQKDVEQKMVAIEQTCLKDFGSEAHKAELLLRIGSDGAAENVRTERQPDRFAYCIMGSLYQSFIRKEKTSSPPPHATYWVILDVDPAALAASSK